MTMTEADGVERQAGLVMARARALVDRVLRDCVDELPRTMRLVAGYQLGWWHWDGTPRTGGGGKALRPALAVAAAEAVGGSGEAALFAAATVELVHNMTLLHDDVMDQDTMRRHQPTAWTVFGTADAILAGDAILALAPRVLAGHGRPAPVASIHRLSACLAELCEAQHADCSFEERVDVTIAECLAMAEGKTGSLLGLSCALGALAAGAPDSVVRALDAFGRQLGLAFQLTDDLLGIWGASEVTGKPVGADLAVHKQSLPVVAALSSDSPAARELLNLYTREHPLNQAEVARAARLVEQAGGRTWALEQASRYEASALALLHEALPRSTDGADLRALTRATIRRTH